MQDTIRQKILVGNDSLKQIRDSVNQQQVKSDTLTITPQIKRFAESQNELTDTTSTCTRGVIADVTFYDPDNFVTSLDIRINDSFPYTFIRKNRELGSVKRENIVKALKTGEDIPDPVYQSDWIVPVVIFGMFLFAIVRSFPGAFFRNMLRFIMMRGVNENSSRDTAMLFQWQSTLLNFASFISISLFGYLSLKHYGVNIEGVGGFLFWLICFGVVGISVALRHLICNITGNFSGETEIFREYIVGIYHFYRIAGIIFLFLVLLVLYTIFLSPNVYFVAGIVAAALLYALRVIRLLLIFIARHVSIFYLILYLCALEILPVVIIVKYITGLV